VENFDNFPFMTSYSNLNQFFTPLYDIILLVYSQVHN